MNLAEVLNFACIVVAVVILSGVVAFPIAIFLVELRDRVGRRR